MAKSRVTIREVSQASGVSIATVSRVINRLGNVSPDTEARVREAIRSLGFHADSMASSLKTGSSRVIGVIVPRFDNDFFMRALNGIDEAIQDTDYSLMFAATHNGQQREQKAIESMLSFKAAGMIIATCGSDASFFEQLDSSGCPIVLIDRTVESARLDMIAEDNIAPAGALARELIDAGHRRLAVFTGDMRLNIMRQRLDGAVTAIRERGLPLPEEHIYHCRNTVDSGQELAHRAFNAWKETDDRPTGILSLNSFVTEGLMTAARDEGLSIPGDISVAGFGQLKSELITPRITAVAQDGHRIGRLAGERLLQRLSHPESAQEKQHILVQNEIKQGDSIRRLN